MKLVVLGGLRRAAVLTVVLAPRLILWSDTLNSLGIALGKSCHGYFGNFRINGPWRSCHVMGTRREGRGLISVSSSYGLRNQV